MIGMGVPDSALAPAYPSAPQPPHSSGPGSATPDMRPSHQTMIGMAPPTVQAARSFSATGKYPTPTPPPPPPAAGQRAPVTQQQLVPSGTQPLLPPGQTMPSSHKTILGVARPGIAPLNPGQPKAPLRAPDSVPSSNLVPSSHVPTSRVPSSPGPVVATPRDEAILRSSPGRPEPNRRIPLVAAIAMVVAAGLFAAALVVWLFYRGHGPVEAHATALADGSEKLELTCAACEDGTSARLDAASTTFSAAHASLPLSRPLKVGNNPMTIALVTPRGKQSFVDIAVPLAFQVRGDTSGLDAPTPELRVLVTALPGSIVTVDGKPLTLNADGEGTYAIDVSALVTGFEPSVKTLERRVPYTVTPPSGTTEDGNVTLQAGITPLVVDAPGASVVLEGSNFVLAGRTSKSGALSVGDRPITVDGAGRFAQMMNVSAPGETTIMLRATSKDSAPRLFPLRVRRVDSLAKEAERLRPLSTNSYATIADQTDAKRGWAVALDGSIVDARTENYSTVIVMDVQSGCARAPCLARITYGAPFTLARGDKLSVFGSLDGVVDGPRTGTKIPQIRADFLLKPSK
ncbi:MAG TPA: hypothetical protein VHV51_23445 [Polyangiaceae bacterium]|nr:hypothetical protein [Polyangiaceae bacterium]